MIDNNVCTIFLQHVYSWLELEASLWLYAVSIFGKLCSEAENLRAHNVDAAPFRAVVVLGTRAQIQGTFIIALIPAYFPIYLTQSG